MFGIGDTEFILILVFAFLLFGPDKLPGMGRTIGRGLRQFRQAQDSVTKVVRSEIVDPMTQAAKEGGAPAATGDEDADLPAEEVRPRSTETFAERRARLAKEKADGAGKDVPEVTSAAPEAPVPVVEKDDKPAEGASEETAPVKDPRSVAALYGLSDDDSGKEERDA